MKHKLSDVTRLNLAIWFWTVSRGAIALLLIFLIWKLISRVVGLSLLILLVAWVIYRLFISFSAVFDRHLRQMARKEEQLSSEVDNDSRK